jgi:hypothetical protein
MSAYGLLLGLLLSVARRSDAFFPTQRVFQQPRMSSAVRMSSVWADFPKPGERRDYPKPDFESTSETMREAGALSAEFTNQLKTDKPLRVAVIGAGLAGLSCAKCASLKLASPLLICEQVPL